jgi:hypothetical protein
MELSHILEKGEGFDYTALEKIHDRSWSEQSSVGWLQ